MKAAIRVGISISEYDEMTPHQLNLYIEIDNERRQADSDDRVALAYTQAFWTIQWLGKQKPDSLDKILGRDKVQKPMTAEEVLEQAKKFNAALGGTSY